MGEWKGNQQFCPERKAAGGYVIAQEVTDFGVLTPAEAGGRAMVAKIRAPVGADSP